MRIIKESSLCERCEKFYKQRHYTGDYTPYCKDNRCTFREEDKIKDSNYNTNKDNLSDTDTPEKVILESIDFQIANLKHSIKELENLRDSILHLIENNEDYLTLFNTIHYNRADVKNKHYL